LPWLYRSLLRGWNLEILLAAAARAARTALLLQPLHDLLALRLAALLQLLQIGIEHVDLRLGPELEQTVLHLLAHQHELDGVLHLVEGLRPAFLEILELDDVPAIIGLHRLRQLARLERQSPLGGLRPPPPGAEISKIRA